MDNNNNLGRNVDVITDSNGVSGFLPDAHGAGGGKRKIYCLNCRQQASIENYALICREKRC